jgi:hypothetical protein
MGAARRRWGRRLGRFGGPALLAALVLTAPQAALAQGVDQSCELALNRLEPQTTNTLLLDTSAAYWIVNYRAVPGTRIRIEGDYPYNRYISWNLYDHAARPIDHLRDTAIRPDAGSFNPFRAGADRLRTPRRYTAFVEFTPRPANPAPNTMYGGEGLGGERNVAGTLWLRVYIPDRGRDIAGGVPLPRVALEPTGSEGGGLTTEQCRAFQAPTPDTLALLTQGPGAPDTGSRTRAWGRDPPNWRLFVNFSMGFADLLTDNENAEGLRDDDGSPPGDHSQGAGIFANRDISYVYAATLREYGEVLVIRGRAPTFPDTRPPAPRMPGGRQVRYFSMCQYEPATQRVIACAPDDRTVVDRHGYFTYVISTPENRPAKAVPRCGVTWIPWGPARHGLLIYRHLIPAPGFRNAIGNIREPGREREVMGDYYPEGRYFANAAAFDAWDCPEAGHGTARTTLAGVPRASRCVSRDFTVTARTQGARPPRRVRVRLNGRTIATTTRTGARIRVPARRLRGGRHRLTVETTDAEGRVFRSTRVFHRCPTQAPPRRASNPSRPSLTG